MAPDVASGTEHAASDDAPPNEKPTHSRKPDALPGYRSPGPPGVSAVAAGGASAGVTWGKLTTTVIMYIDELIDSATRHAKGNYISQSACVVEAIRMMLYASGTAEKDSPLVRAHKILKVHHRNIMAVLSNLVLSAKLAAGASPPPDADHRLHIDANEVLLTVRQFVAAVRDAGVRCPSPELRAVSPVSTASSGSGGGDGAVRVPLPLSTARQQQQQQQQHQQQQQQQHQRQQSAQQGSDAPWFLSYDYPSDDLVFNADGLVKAGTFEALVQRLTLHHAHDASFNSTFMLCHRSFATNDEFFEALVRRFNIQPPLDLTPAEWELWMEKKQKPIRLRMFNILKSWLENYYDENEQDDKAVLYRLRDFAATTIHEHMPFAAMQLIKNIDKKLSSETSTRKMILNLAVAAPVPILPKYRKRLKFTDINALEVARQLTILDSRLYKLIRPIECLQKAWSDKENPHRAPNIKAMIATSNHITGWVVDSILAEVDVKKRTSLIKHFISVAEACRNLHNFNTLMSILAGLSSAPIHRLTRTWELVNSKSVATLESLRNLMSPTKNFTEYREELHSRNPPAVPFLGVYLTDLTFIEDGNPDRLRSQPRLINFSKRTKTAEVIREIQKYQSVPYALTAVRELQDFLKRCLNESRDVHDLYDRSLAMEPREREDEKIARLLQESGFL